MYNNVAKAIHTLIFALQYKGANIQLLDLPGIIEGAAQGEFIFFVFKVSRLLDYYNVK